jgi:tetraacyldisaccharide 4'-kinase
VDRIAASIRRHNPRAPVAVGRIEPLAAEDKFRGERVAPAALAGRRLLAFAGLARPQGFLATLGELGVLVATTVEYPDHHWFTQEEMAELMRQARALGAEGLITSEKDWARLRGLALTAPLWVLSARLALTAGHPELLEALGRVVPREPAARP